MSARLRAVVERLDGGALTAADRRFDVVFAVRAGLFRREPDRARELAERWLVPGGRLHAVFDAPS